MTESELDPRGDVDGHMVSVGDQVLFEWGFGLEDHCTDRGLGLVISMQEQPLWVATIMWSGPHAPCRLEPVNMWSLRKVIG